MPGIPHIDVLIVGAGLSGICTARHLQDQCPRKTFLILEGREKLGGTWELFKYPGIRSDSDMATLGYRFRPWTGEKLIADGADILSYINEAASETGIPDHIRFNSRVKKAEWSEQNKTWTISVEDSGNKAQIQYTCSFLISCSGYYSYEKGYTPDFRNLEKYQGTFIHPQKWPEDLDYKGKNIVVIGSGATAVTLLPALAQNGANHVTMLQRSPTYYLSAPRTDALQKTLNYILPQKLTYQVVRWKNILAGSLFHQACKRFPDFMKKALIKRVAQALPPDYDIEKHFTPKYRPWDQRLCLVPNGDLFKAIRTGKCSVVTDEIEAFTESGIQLKSGQQLEADIVVSATGLNLLALGNIEIWVGGKKINPADQYTYKSGIMLSGVPNLGIVMGYTNASWTLKADLAAEYMCRLINFMDQRGYCKAVAEYGKDTKRVPFMTGLNSGYIQRAIDQFPSQGEKDPWLIHQNYLKDLRLLRRGKIDDGEIGFE